MSSKPQMEVLKGGSQKDAQCHELLMEIIKPRMNPRKVKRLEAAIAPRGKLALVKSATDRGA